MPLNTYNAATNLFVALPGPVSPPGFLTDADLNAAKAHSDAQAVAAMAAAAAAQSAAVSAAAAAVAANARVIPPAYTLPPATAAALGGFKPGTTLASTADGTTDVVGQTIAQTATTTAPAGTLYVVLFQADGTPQKITLAAYQALAGWNAAAAAPAPVLTLTAPTGVAGGTSYNIAGTAANYATSPTLTVSVDAGTFGTLPAGSTVSGGNISLSMPGIATGTHTVQVKDANGVLSNTVSFAVAAAALVFGTKALLTSASGAGSASTPYQASLNATSLIDLRVFINTPSYAGNAGNFSPMLSVWDGSNGYEFGLLPSGTMQCFFNANIGFVGTQSTVAIANAVNSNVGLRVSVNTSTAAISGIPANTARYYTSADDGATWLQSGADVAVAGTTSFYSAGPSPITTGQSASISQPMPANAKFRRSQVMVDGVLVYDANFSTQTAAATSFTTAAGQTVTVNAPGTIA